MRYASPRDSAGGKNKRSNPVLALSLKEVFPGCTEIQQMEAWSKKTKRKEHSGGL